MAAMLHDIGMLTIPAAVLNQTTTLSREERALVQQHPATGTIWLARAGAGNKDALSLQERRSITAAKKPSV